MAGRGPLAGDRRQFLARPDPHLTGSAHPAGPLSGPRTARERTRSAAAPRGARPAAPVAVGEADHPSPWATK
ncbi:hypothetical protein SGPA1_21005 [Streptomyces misionensis JCM 4497]